MDLRPQRRIILPLDVSDPAEAIDLAGRLYQYVGVLKIGPQLLLAGGTAMLEMGEGMGLKTFLDLKFHDIPNTVARSIESAAKYGVNFATVHAAGGRKMLFEAVKAAPPGMTLLAVTMLTSLSESDLRTGLQIQDLSTLSGAGQSQSYVLSMAKMAYDAGIRGFVCSPHEVGLLRTELGKDVTLVVPGVRLADSDKNDQERVATPEQAIQDGASYLVIGRPILQAKDPRIAAAAIAESIRPYTGKYDY